MLADRSEGLTQVADVLENLHGGLALLCYATEDLTEDFLDCAEDREVYSRLTALIAGIGDCKNEAIALCSDVSELRDRVDQQERRQERRQEPATV